MATIHDVAHAAGVSIATVSRVFNGSTRVSEPTRLRVWKASRKLDYWPNTAARSLTTNRTQTLGVLLPDIYGEFFSEVIRGIDLAARESGYQILISSSHADQHAIVSAAQAMQGRIDGMLIMASDEESAHAIRRIETRFPLVLLNPRFASGQCGSVAVANFEGASAAVDHLVRLGHQRIAIIKGPEGNVDAEERRRGYRKALEESDVDPAPELELSGDFTESSGFRAMKAILDLDPRPTAVFAANDSMAVGALSAMQTAGLQAPDDAAIIGFDDIAIARYLNPPLTTVHVDAFDLGKRAVIQLLDTLESDEGARRPHEVLPVTLVVRQTCGHKNAPRKDRRRPILAAEDA